VISAACCTKKFRTCYSCFTWTNIEKMTDLVRSNWPMEPISQSQADKLRKPRTKHLALSRNELITNYESLVVDARNNQLLFIHAHRSRVNVHFNRRHSSKIGQANENVDIKILKRPKGNLLSARAINSEHGHAVYIVIKPYWMKGAIIKNKFKNGCLYILKTTLKKVFEHSCFFYNLDSGLFV